MTLNVVEISNALVFPGNADQHRHQSISNTSVLFNQQTKTVTTLYNHQWFTLTLNIWKNLTLNLNM